MTRPFRIALVLVTLALAACGGSQSCRDACNTLDACALNSSGLSCDASCGGTDADCARCISTTSCQDIGSGSCASSCPGVTFTPRSS